MKDTNKTWIGDLVVTDKTSTVFRAWRYYRDGHNLYISKPMSIFNFLTVTYYLMMERVPFLKQVFTHFYIFSIFTFTVLVASSIYLGWWNMRRRKGSPFGVEQILAVESNPQTPYFQKTHLELLFGLYEKLGLPIPEEARRLYEYWKQLDHKWKWRP